MVRCGPGRSVTAPGKPSWVCFERVVEDSAFQGTSRWLSNEDPSERFCLGLGVGKGAVFESLVCFCCIDAENILATPVSFFILVGTGSPVTRV